MFCFQTNHFISRFSSSFPTSSLHLHIHTYAHTCAHTGRISQGCHSLQIFGSPGRTKYLRQLLVSVSVPLTLGCYLKLFRGIPPVPSFCCCYPPSRTLWVGLHSLGSSYTRCLKLPRLIQAPRYNPAFPHPSVSPSHTSLVLGTPIPYLPPTQAPNPPTYLPACCRDKVPSIANPSHHLLATDTTALPLPLPFLPYLR